MDHERGFSKRQQAEFCTRMSLNVTVFEGESVNFGAINTWIASADLTTQC